MAEKVDGHSFNSGSPADSFDSEDSSLENGAQSQNAFPPVTPSGGEVDEMLRDLCKAYADILSRQGNTTSAYSTWTESTRRGISFTWLNKPGSRDEIMTKENGQLSFTPGDSGYEQTHKMFGTANLNPYEREMQYGYPYVIGKIGTKKIRGPLLTMAVQMEAVGDKLLVEAIEGQFRVNLLPFRREGDSDAHQEALNRILAATPEYPLTPSSLKAFVDVVKREVPGLKIDAVLDGQVKAAPSAVPAGSGLKVIDSAALFLAPRTNYFLRKDLEEISTVAEMRSNQEMVAEDQRGISPAFRTMMKGDVSGARVEITEKQIDRAEVIFPFPSNRAQRKVALLLEDDRTNVVRVEGPPGTGKSLTIANLACHLAAKGQTVLITSQKDKALEVVDEKLKMLDLPEIPMTLLRHDASSKGNLLSRLDGVEKRRGATEVVDEYTVLDAKFGIEADDLRSDLEQYILALQSESDVERTSREAFRSRGLRRLARSVRARNTLRRANRVSPMTTDELAEGMSAKRSQFLDLSRLLLQIGLERDVAQANRLGANTVNKLKAVLKRNQKSYKNFSMFDRFKDEPDNAVALLQVLPVWIMAPDDVARIFPCTPNLFDVVIIDEASQVDLPSIAPILYRAKKIVVFGDTKQMQSRRFAFQSATIATQAWSQFHMEKHDPDGWLDPMKQSLLTLASLHSEEECLLDEHFRSLPPIIEFSNERWYNNRLRIMTDIQRKKFGGPNQPAIEMHFVADGKVKEETQENEKEAKELLKCLQELVVNPDYSGASIGVMCLFEEQVSLVEELVASSIPAEEWEEHSLVVVNPDGFQGDERDIILYSFSWDNDKMPKAALSARQMEDDHIQGMLNVAFTRARDEIHVFYSAPIDTFGKASGTRATIADWLEHCEAVFEGKEVREYPKLGKTDSEFEAEVGSALRASGVHVVHQYPSCGFSIDLVCELDGNRLAVECDGEIYHMDEHGELKIEDVERQAILERAGWSVLRIPYRKWQSDPEDEVARVIAKLRGEEHYEKGSEAGRTTDTQDGNGLLVEVSDTQRRIVEAVRSGLKSEEEVFKDVRIGLGYSRMGPNIKRDINSAALALESKGFLTIEDGEYFLAPQGRGATFEVKYDPPLFRPAARTTRKSASYKKSRSRKRGRRGRYY